MTKNKILKIGLDVHGVSNEVPEFFAELAKTLIAAGHEVHVLSGPPIAQIKEELSKLQIPYTHLFSIVDFHKERGTPMHQDSKGNWHLSGKYGGWWWDRTKGDYCLKNHVSLMLDDSDRYGYFFTTPYARFYSKDKRKHHIDEDESGNKNEIS